MGPLLALLNSRGKTIEESPVSTEHLAGLLKLIDEDIISGKIAKTVFEDIAETGRPPEEIVKAKGLVQLTDESAIEKIVMDVIKSSPEEVAAFKKGKKKLMGYFVGRIMKETKGKANPKIVNNLLSRKLS
jgi:aspartyl-tRNA(Asn)/glutamyl-tRNA(Gln) amidotransferase subunit B